MSVINPLEPQMTIIKCLSCGKPVRLGGDDESPQKDHSQRGGANAKRWFCSRQCLLYYAALKRQEVKNPNLVARNHNLKAENLDWMIDVINRGGVNPER